jgi:hypothetical protein
VTTAITLEVAVREVIRVDGKFRVSARSQLEKVQALPLAFRRDALRIESIDQKVQGIGKGENGA